ncbi:hypothetical protein OBA37_02160 [Candidatus Pelagibacter sp.]|nr:hypothetical protein [Candidatus Pelagibacter sp.]
MGRSLVGRITQGTAKANQAIKAINLKGEKIDEGRLTKIFRYEGTKKVPIEVGEAGDIVIIAGLEKANVADTICDLEVNQPIAATPIDPPTMSIKITVNTSPLAGTEGKKLTSTQIRDRLIQEAQNNVGITFSENDGNDSFVVSGRGELMLEILLTQMRREGFEMTVSPPKVLYKKNDKGEKLEPLEEITMDLDEEYSSKIIDSMNRRKGKLIELKDTGKNKKRLIFHAPTRGLMGYTSRFLTLTKGNGVINRIFHGYGPFEGEMEGRRNGALISMEKGKAVAFAIFNLQARGEMFVTHNDPVYPGMIVGLSPKPGDMIINVMKGKKFNFKDKKKVFGKRKRDRGKKNEEKKYFDFKGKKKYFKKKHTKPTGFTNNPLYFEKKPLEDIPLSEERESYSIKGNRKFKNRSNRPRQFVYKKHDKKRKNFKTF